MKLNFLSIFQKRKKKVRRRKTRKNHKPKDENEFNRLKSDFNNLKAQFGTVNILLKKHDEEIAENSILIEKHTKSIGKLEQLVANPLINPPKPTSSPVSRPIAATNPPPLSQIPPQQNTRQFDINRFSQQEKRILSVFFQNQDMALSYADIANSLNKSPNTIKNQMRQINIKADLFDKTLDVDQRKRYKFKDGLKIEKYINMH
jgi:DNA-binding CsgD family transcriptional regulator